MNSTDGKRFYSVGPSKNGDVATLSDVLYIVQGKEHSNVDNVSCTFCPTFVLIINLKKYYFVAGSGRK